MQTIKMIIKLAYYAPTYTTYTTNNLQDTNIFFSLLLLLVLHKNIILYCFQQHGPIHKLKIYNSVIL